MMILPCLYCGEPVMSGIDDDNLDGLIHHECLVRLRTEVETACGGHDVYPIRKARSAWTSAGRPRDLTVGDVE